MNRIAFEVSAYLRLGREGKSCQSCHSCEFCLEGDGRAVRAPAAMRGRWNAEIARNAEATSRLHIGSWVSGREDKAR